MITEIISAAYFSWTCGINMSSVSVELLWGWIYYQFLQNICVLSEKCVFYSMSSIC